MRILHVFKDYSPVPGGIERHVETLARGQVAKGHEVSVAVAGRDLSTSVCGEHGVEVTRYGRLATLRSTPLSPGLMRAVRPHSADIVHLHFPHPPGELAWVLSRFRPPAVLTYHADIVRQRFLARLLRPLTRSVLERVGRIIVGNPRIGESSRTLACYTDKVEVVPFGIPLPPEIATDDPVLAGLCEGHSGPRILFVGCLRHYKGIQHLLAAMETIDGALLIVGDGPERKPLERIASALPWSDRCRFLGRVADDELWRAYSAADIFVLPSDSPAEAHGLVLLEAMAMGLPLVSTELGTGTSWVNQHGETGFVVPPGDPPALAAAINRLLNSQELRGRFGRAARSTYEADFTSQRMVDRVLKCYGSVLKRGC